MTEFLINDEDFKSLKGKHIVVTGTSSGIGLATIELLLAQGAYVTAGDLSPCPLEHLNLRSTVVDVTSWSSLSALFKHAIEHRPEIDHVFANAGISGRANYLEEKLDSNGDLVEPTHEVFDINLKGVINTSYLGLHYMRKNPGNDHSIVLTASCSSFQRFRIVDYATTKHAVLGFMRGMVPALQGGGVQVRINALAPSWTSTGMVPEYFLINAKIPWQKADAVARSVALLMSDSTRNGQLIHSAEGRFKEVEEGVLLKVLPDILGDNETDDDATVRLVRTATEMRLAAADGAQT